MLLRVLALLYFLAPLARADAPPPPPIAARAWLLVDLASGQPIAAQNADERIEPASLTKLMTAYLVFDALKKKAIQSEQTAPVSQRAWKAGGVLQVEQAAIPARHLDALVAQVGGPLRNRIQRVERRCIARELRQKYRRSLDRFHDFK